MILFIAQFIVKDSTVNAVTYDTNILRYVLG